MADVLFKEGTNTQYSSITPDDYTFYKVRDSSAEDPDVYLGTVKLSNQVDIDKLLAELDALEQRVNDLEDYVHFYLFGSYSCREVVNIVQSGQAENYWSVGDTTNLITFNGALGDYLTFEDYKCKAILIGFDHNKDLETGGKYNITLQFGQDEDGINIAFIDSRYSTAGNNYNCLCMNMTDTNVGGWESSHMRNDICPQFFLELLPSGLQNIIGTTTKYTDNVGGGSGSVESNVTATQDKIFLLSLHEVGGTSTSYANTYEANYTEPYSEMYSSNSGRIKYRHSASGSTSYWWGRSPYRSDNYTFCYVNTSGYTGNDYTANGSSGFAPACAIY